VVPIEFRILGPLEAFKDGHVLALGGAKQRAVLALLLLTANERVSAERLIEELWHGSSPPTAAKSLQMHVARLRQALGESDSAQPDAVVQTLPSGYRICVEQGALDRERFETAVSEGRRLLAAGEPEEAGHHLRAALAEWRGPALADLADEPFARLEVARLDELKLAALEDRIEADLATGRHGELVAELEALVAVEMFRERLWRQLMLALYRSGRQAEALAAYQRVRAHLVEQLGIEPGRELQQLHQAVLAQDGRLERHSPHDASAAAGQVLAGRGSDVSRNNLPAIGTSFVGREDEVAAIEAHLKGSRVVTLTGVGGVGKTRLAFEVAERTLKSWPDGVWVVELASISERSAVAEAVASRLGLTTDQDSDVADAIANRLAQRSMLLVLDNCEHVLDACAALAARIARGRSASRLLTTSRAPLAVAAERVVRVSPLPVPGDEADQADRLAVDAVRLFLDRARDARPQFATRTRELEAVGEICRALDGVPLAIELAASRVRAMSPTEILSRLGSRLSLGGDERDREARHRNLEATIRWSYDLLEKHEQKAFRRLCVFPAPFTLAAAEHVVGGDNVVDAIVGLVDNSVLAVVEQPGHTRYRMLETLREFGLRRLTHAGEEADARSSHLDWALEFVEVAASDAETRRRTEVLPGVEAEHRNLVRAIAAEGELTKRLRLAAGLAVLLTAGTSLREIHRLLDDVLTAAGGLNTVEVRRARLLLGRARCRLGALDAARTHLAATAQYAAAAGDQRLAAAVAADQALVEIKAGRQAEAQRFLDEADRLGASLDRHVWTYRLLVEAQMCYDLLGRMQRARELYETCIDLVRRHGPPAHLITALAALAELAVDLKDPDTVESCAREVLAIADPVADAYPRGGAVLALGRAALAAGRPVEATNWLTEGARSDVERGSMETPEMLESLAHAVARSDRATAAATLLGAAAGLREHLGLGPLERQQVYIDATLDTIHAKLSASAVQRCLSDGSRLTERELIALVDGQVSAAPGA
jgi:predicted ATPase/DNA-binding SARP family transcriptional activator